MAVGCLVWGMIVRLWVPMQVVWLCVHMGLEKHTKPKKRERGSKHPQNSVTSLMKGPYLNGDSSISIFISSIKKFFDGFCVSTILQTFANHKCCHFLLSYFLVTLSLLWHWTFVDFFLRPVKSFKTMYNFETKACKQSSCCKVGMTNVHNLQ